MTRKKNLESVLKEAVEITKNMHAFLIKKEASLAQATHCLHFLAFTVLLKDGASQRELETLYKKAFRIVSRRDQRVKKSEKSEQE